jgi:polyisoprenyl-teichoic acid--peptidoglycan teichoic acid transferase
VSVYEEVEPRPETPGRSLLKRAALGSAVIVFLVTVTVSTALLLEVDSVVQEFVRDKSGAINDVGTEITPDEAGSPQTLMLLGSDRRLADKKLGIKGNSDTIILVRLDPDKDSTTVVSLPRDLAVDIPGFGRDKINKAYGHGGPKLVLRTVKNLLSTPQYGRFKINHVINVNFGGFTKAVDYLGCVYMDIDRRYFNDNSQGGERFAEIDIEPGYQRLCGENALAFARFRHYDNDLVRAARQQDFLRQVKEQVGAKQLFDNRRKLAKLVGTYTQTDRGLRDNESVLRLAKLAAFQAGKPVREVKFPAIIPEDPKQTNISFSQARLEKAIAQFMEGKSTSGPKGELKSTPAELAEAKRTKKRRQVASGLEQAKAPGEDQAIVAAQRTNYPVYYPKLRRSGSVYVDQPRTYNIRDLAGNKFRAYRMVAKLGGIGEYYGIQGMNWKNPPILAKPDDRKMVSGRRLELFYDGSRLRLVAYRRGNNVYWVANTLLRTLTNKQMLGIAASLTPVGR